MPSPALISHSPTLPRLPEADFRLFDQYASCRLDIHALAEHSGRSMAELTAWAAAPEIRVWAEAYREIAGHSLITAAIAALVETMKATENLVEKRRAAQAVIRAHQTPRRQPTFTVAAAKSPSSPTGGGGSALRAGGGSVPTPSTNAPSTNTAPAQRSTPTHADSPSSPTGGGPALRGGGGSVSTPSTNAPSTNAAPPQRSTAALSTSFPPTPPPRTITHSPSPATNHNSIHPSTSVLASLHPHPSASSAAASFPSSSLSPFASRPSPLTALLSAAGNPGPAP